VSQVLAERQWTHRVPGPLKLCALAYARDSEGDVDRTLALFDPEVEAFVAPPTSRVAPTIGHAEYRALVERWAGSWDEMRIEPRRLEAVGDWVLAVVEYIGCGKESGVEIAQQSWELSYWPEKGTLQAIRDLLGCGAWAARVRDPPARRA
jgi:hypothetical protein